MCVRYIFVVPVLGQALRDTIVNVSKPLPFQELIF